MSILFTTAAFAVGGVEESETGNQELCSVFVDKHTLFLVVLLTAVSGAHLYEYDIDKSQAGHDHRADGIRTRSMVNF